MNIALIDRHPVFRTGMRVLLKRQFDNITTLETGSMQSFKKVAPQEPTDIIIIGLSEEQPEIDRVALKRMMRKNPMASFIVYASKPGYELAKSLMRIGVKGCLTKNSRPEELVICVNAVMSGEAYLCPQIQTLVPEKTKRSTEKRNVA